MIEIWKDIPGYEDRYCSGISNCLRGRTKTIYNYIFKYEDEENKK